MTCVTPAIGGRKVAPQNVEGRCRNARPGSERPTEWRARGGSGACHPGRRQRRHTKKEAARPSPVRSPFLSVDADRSPSTTPTSPLIRNIIRLVPARPPAIPVSQVAGPMPCTRSPLQASHLAGAKLIEPASRRKRRSRAACRFPVADRSEPASPAVPNCFIDAHANRAAISPQFWLAENSLGLQRSQRRLPIGRRPTAGIQGRPRATFPQPARSQTRRGAAYPRDSSATVKCEGRDTGPDRAAPGAARRERGRRGHAPRLRRTTSRPRGRGEARAAGRWTCAREAR